MDNVTVEKSILIQELEKNYTAHKQEHQEAYEAWRTAKLIELKNWREALSHSEEIPEHSTLMRPVSYAKEYERAIKMVKMSVDEQIYLTQRDFSRYIMDEWEWVDTFNSVNSFYKSAQFRQ